MIKAEKVRITLAHIPFILDPGTKSPKKIAKNFKNFEKLLPALFLAKTG